MTTRNRTCSTRVLGIKGNIHLASQSEILLRVVLVLAIDEGIAAEGVARIERGPEAGGEGIADVSFESG